VTGRTSEGGKEKTPVARDPEGHWWDDAWLAVYSAEIPGDPERWAYAPDLGQLAIDYRAAHPGHPWGTEAGVYYRCLYLRKQHYRVGGVEIRTSGKRRGPARGSNLSPAMVRHLVEAYDAQPLTRDQLPYTPEFEAIFAAFRERWGPEYARNWVWVSLTTLGKAGRLARKLHAYRGRRTKKPVGFGFRK
jgi:hypothetical protein